MDADTKNEKREFARFEALAKKLISVPKKDIQEREKAEKKASRIETKKLRS